MLRFGLGIALAIAILDQATKRWIENIIEIGQFVHALPILNIVHARNRGVSFGILNESAAWIPWVLGIVALAIIGVLIAWLRRSENRWMAAALGLIIGGAVGNLIDRAANFDHAVIDFLDFYFGTYHWPAFNVADSAITVGVGVLLIDALIAPRDRPKVAPGGEESG